MFTAQTLGALSELDLARTLAAPAPRTLLLGEVAPKVVTHLEGLGGLLELRLGVGVVRVDVRVQLAGQLAKRLLDRRLVGVAGDAEGFYEAETESRREAGAPPFGRLAAIIVSSEDQRAAAASAAASSASSRSDLTGGDAGREDDPEERREPPR